MVMTPEPTPRANMKPAHRGPVAHQRLQAHPDGNEGAGDHRPGAARAGVHEARHQQAERRCRPRPAARAAPRGFLAEAEVLQQQGVERHRERKGQRREVGAHDAVEQHRHADQQRHSCRTGRGREHPGAAAAACPTQQQCRDRQRRQHAEGGLNPPSASTKPQLPLPRIWPRLLTAFRRPACTPRAPGSSAAMDQLAGQKVARASTRIIWAQKSVVKSQAKGIAAAPAASSTEEASMMRLPPTRST